MRAIPVFLAFLAACGGGGGEAQKDAPGTDAPDVLAPTDPGQTPEITPDPGGSDPGLPGVDVSPSRPNYVILAADDLAEAAQGLADYRAATGFRPQVIRVSDIAFPNAGPAEKVNAVRDMLQKFKQALGKDETLFLTLFGDAPGLAESQVGEIPALVCENHYGDCYTDNTYGDLDGDRIPDVAIGRIPVRTAGEAAAFLSKLKTHESQYEVGLWNRRIGIYTGKANFNPQVDTLIEMAVMQGLTAVSHAFDIVGAYDNTKSEYYYDPFTEKVVSLFNDGAIAVVYVGHGLTTWTEGLTDAELALIHCQHRLPFSVMFACLAGQYMAAGPSLAEQLLAKMDGPIAVWASSDVSHPYGNAVMAYEFQRSLLDERGATIGEILMAAKRATLENADDFRTFIDGIAEVQVDAAEQAVIRIQHLDLYNLLGDPATSPRYPPHEVTGQTSGSVASGKVSVDGKIEGMTNGTAHVTVEVERDIIVGTLDPVDPKKPDKATVQANWAKANNKVIGAADVPVAGGVFHADVEVSKDAPGTAFYLKVYAQDGKTDAFGVMGL